MPEFFNLSSPCRQNYSYFASAEYLKTCYHCSAVPDLIVAVLVFYCILKVTPKPMNSMKWVLLNLHIWYVHVDIFLTILAAPYIFFPSRSGIPLGILGDLRVNGALQCYYGQCAGTFAAVATVMLYENRQNQVYTITNKITRTFTRIVYYGVNYFIALTFALPFFTDNASQTELKHFILQRLPCPTVEFDDPRAYFLMRGGERLPFWAANALVFVFVSQLGFFATRTVYHLVFVNSTSVSASTKKLQQQFFISASIQVSIPFLVVVLPISYLLYCGELKYYNQALNNHACCILANYGFFSSVSTLLVYKPYRQFCIDLCLCRRHRHSTPITVISSEMTTKVHI